MDEYIERESLIRHLNEQKATPPEMCYTFAVIDSVQDFVKNQPPADVAPVVHSRWEECDYVEPCVHGFGTNRIKDAGMKCLNCVHVFKKELLWANNYCPNCGAKMSLGD